MQKKEKKRGRVRDLERQPCKYPGESNGSLFSSQEKPYLSQSPSPGRRATPPRSAMNLGRVRCVITSAVQFNSSGAEFRM